jgi:hypothetical protein
MTKTAVDSRAEEIARRFGKDAVMLHSYSGTCVVPPAVEAISAWDVSSHAQREQARFCTPRPRAEGAGY